MGTALVICSGKGGVGKSTLSVGIAYALEKNNKKVIILDCDAGLRTTDKITGIEEDLLFDMADVLKGNCTPSQATYKVKFCAELYVMPAPEDASQEIKLSELKKITNMLKEHYDYVLLDCPAGVGDTFDSAVLCADEHIVVSTPDPVCVRSAMYVNNLLIKKGINRHRLLINRFSPKLFKEVDLIRDLDHVIDQTGIRLLGVVPEDSKMSAQILKGTRPVSSAVGMQALSRVATRIMGENCPVILK